MAAALADRPRTMWTTSRFPALWLLPVLVPVAIFTIFPVAHALWTSLHQVMLLFPEQDWVGLENYRNVVTDEYFSVALKNSLLFTLFSAPLIVVIGTATALFLNREFYGVTALRSIVLLPWVLPGAISLFRNTVMDTMVSDRPCLIDVRSCRQAYHKDANADLVQGGAVQVDPVPAGNRLVSHA